jgi:aspartate racemase
MNKIGIIGGIGPASTVEYYNGIIKGYQELTNDENYPQIFINSINMTEMLNYLVNSNREGLIDLLTAEIDKLRIIGADFVAVASNTPHLVIDNLIEKSLIPIISIVEETCKYAKIKALKRVLLTGTLFTMKNNFYETAFEKYNIECIVPDDNDKNVIHNIIFPNLENGIIIEKDKSVLKDLCNKIIREKKIDGIILGCTELPLILNENDFNVCVLDTVKIHVKSILKKMIQDE